MEVRDECAHAVGCLIKCGVAHDDEEAIQSPISFWILAGVNSLLSGECCFLFFSSNILRGDKRQCADKRRRRLRM